VRLCSEGCVRKCCAWGRAGQRRVASWTADPVKTYPHWESGLGRGSVRGFGRIEVLVSCEVVMANDAFWLEVVYDSWNVHTRICDGLEMKVDLDCAYINSSARDTVIFLKMMAPQNDIP
jgi:hypothetical protein